MSVGLPASTIDHVSNRLRRDALCILIILLASFASLEAVLCTSFAAQMARGAIVFGAMRLTLIILLASFASLEAVLRTSFAAQMARGAIVFGALASELADAPYIDYTTNFDFLQGREIQ